MRAPLIVPKDSFPKVSASLGIENPPGVGLDFRRARGKIVSMTDSAKHTRARPYRSLGTTSDGVVILAPKLAPTHFKPGDIRKIVAEMKRDEADRDAVAQVEERSSSPKKA